jgi:hypothetical protein
MRDRPTLDAKEIFLRGGKADMEKKPVEWESPPVPVKIAREQKIVRLPSTLVSELRTFAYRQSDAQNRRVTETEIVEEAIKEFIDKYSR